MTKTQLMDKTSDLVWIQNAVSSLTNLSKQTIKNKSIQEAVTLLASEMITLTLEVSAEVSDERTKTSI